MWYYNEESGDCESFLWRGAGGNNNRFVTYDICASVCKKSFGKEVQLINNFANLK